MATFFESDGEIEELDIPTVLLPYQYEPAPTHSDVDEVLSSRSNNTRAPPSPDLLHH